MFVKHKNMTIKICGVCQENLTENLPPYFGYDVRCVECGIHLCIPENSSCCTRCNSCGGSCCHACTKVCDLCYELCCIHCNDNCKKNVTTVPTTTFTYGKILSECRYVGGKKHGEYIEVENGRIRIRCQYVNGKKHGAYFVLDKKGRILETSVYVNGNIIYGTCNTYYNVHLSTKKELLPKTNIINFTSWHHPKDGRLISMNCQYRFMGMPARHGYVYDEEFFDHDSTMNWKSYGDPTYDRKFSKYKGPIKHGIHRIWHKNGQLSKKCTYFDDKLHGEYYEWHKNGQLLKKCTYFDDKLHGEYMFWYYKDGEDFLKKYQYVDGQKHGEYYQEKNGEVVKRYQFANDKFIRDITKKKMEKL